MPKVGIEPTIPKEHDFESCASASSATPARPAQYNTAPYPVKMKLGIIGLPQSGKTTIFNALTRGNTPTTSSAGRMEVHTAVVDVPDARVDRLSAMFKPQKDDLRQGDLRRYRRARRRRQEPASPASC